MEGVATFSLVCNILHLLDITRKIVDNARELRSSGTTAANKEMFSVSRSISEDILAITQDTQDSELKNLITACSELVKSHEANLEAIRLEDQKGIWRRIWKSSKLAYKKNEFESTQTRIGKLSQQISNHYLNHTLKNAEKTLIHMEGSLHVFEKRIEEDLPTMQSKLNEIQDLTRQTLSATETTNGTITNLSKWFHHQKEYRECLKCFRSLYFSALKIREDNITKAHQKTFGWIFEATEGSSTDELKFRHWLQSEKPVGNLFWISGKPGAGKSTLMKFLANNPKLEENLKNWSKDRRLLIVTHYFWRNGSSLQRSLKGLMRSILFQILDAHHNLIPKVFPKREWVHCGPEYDFPMKDLEEALRTSIESVCEGKSCLFIMIDGLDEFDDQPDYLRPHQEAQNAEKLLEFLKIFDAVQHVKLCVSSRPYEEFRKAYESLERSMAIHTLTANDIRQYIEQRLFANAKFSELASQDEKYKLLISMTSDAAQGVFLWVRLALDSLLRIINRSRPTNLAELKELLQSLPSELDELFEKIISSIQPYDRKSAARSLLLAAERECLLINHYYQDERLRGKARPQDIFDSKSDQRIVEDMAGEVNERCRALFTVSKKDHTHSYSHWNKTPSPLPYNIATDLRETNVSLIHRTLSEYLLQQHVQEMLMEMAGSVVDTSQILCEAQLPVIESALVLLSREHDLDSLKEAYSYSYTSLKSWVSWLGKLGRGRASKFWSELEDLMQCWDSSHQNHLHKASYMLFEHLRIYSAFPTRSAPTRFHIAISHLHTWSQVIETVRYEYEHDSNTLHSNATELLFLVLMAWHPCKQSDPSLEIVYFLLDHGAKINDAFPGCSNTLWTIFVISLLNLLNFQTGSELENHALLSAVRNIVTKSGADLKALCHIETHDKLPRWVYPLSIEKPRAALDIFLPCRISAIASGVIIKWFFQGNARLNGCDQEDLEWLSGLPPIPEEQAPEKIIPAFFATEHRLV